MYRRLGAGQRSEAASCAGSAHSSLRQITAGAGGVRDEYGGRVRQTRQPVDAEHEHCEESYMYVDKSCAHAPLA